MTGSSRQPQLRLLAGGRNRRPEWHLTDEARQVGRAGIARARAALAAVQPNDQALRTEGESAPDVRRAG